MKRIVMFSGGIGSWATAKLVAEEHGVEGMVLLFADTLIEDEDLYRFIKEAAANVGVPLTTIAEGRTPWQVFFDRRFLGNSRIDPCSETLKRKCIRRWLKKNHKPEDTVIYLGIDWTEAHRFERAKKYWEPWQVESPLIDTAITKKEMFDALKNNGIESPRLYGMGFPHNNCGGFCVKAGQAHFKNLFKHLPERFLEHEKKESELRCYLKKNVTILRTSIGGRRVLLPLRELRRRIEEGGEIDEHEWGGCGCFSPT